MNLTTLKFSFLYLVGIIAILSNLYALVAMRDIWTDPLYDASDQIQFTMQVIFWLIFGALLCGALIKRSRQAKGITLIALLYVLVSTLTTVVPLAQFYLSSTSGWAGIKILGAVASFGLTQMAVFIIAFFVARNLHIKEHLS